MKRISIICAMLLAACHAMAVTIKDANDFVFSEDGTGVTGLTDAAKSKLTESAEIILPEKSTSGVTVKKVHHKAFSGLTSLAKVVIPANYDTLYSLSFSSCTNLKEVHIESTSLSNRIYTIDNNIGTVFPYAESLYIEADFVGARFFQGQTNLKHLHLNVETIEESAFANCSALEDVQDVRSTTIEESAFFRTNLKTVTFPKVTKIGYYAFSGCNSLLTAYFPSLERTDGYVFYDDSKLVAVNAPELISTGDKMFYNCTAFTNVDPESANQYQYPNLTTIGASCFENCVRLTDAVFEKSVSISQIKNRAFYGCGDISSTRYIIGGIDGVVARPVSIVGKEAFVATGVNRLYVPQTLSFVEKGAFPPLRELTVDCLGLLTYDNTKLLDVFELVNDGTATLKVGGSDKKCSIGANNFNSATNLHLKKLVIADSIGSIREYGFYGITADSIIIGKNADFDCEVDKIQMICKDHLTVTSRKLFVKNSKKVFSATANLHNVFGWDFKTLDATFEDAKGSYCSAYVFYTGADHTSALERVNSNLHGLNEYAFYGNSKMVYLNLDALQSIDAYALYGCNNRVLHTNPDVIVKFGNYSMAKNPLEVIVFDGTFACTFGTGVFDGVSPLMVYDKFGKVRFSGNTTNTLMVVNEESTANELRKGGYPFSVSDLRMTRTAEDVDMDGGLNGNDVQLIYNAMK